MEQNRTRERLLEILREHPSGLTIGQLGERLSLKHNAVRKQLIALTGAGLVAGELVPAPSAGRPATRFRLSGPPSPGHAERMLSRMLLRAVEDVDATTAERIAFETRPAQRLEDTLGSLGFAPTDISSATERRAGRRTIELRACPFLDLVVGEPHGRLVCAFHRGLVRRDMPHGATLEEFRIVPEGPRCRIALSGVESREGKAA